MVNTEWAEREYVAMGSSFAAGPGIGKRAPAAPKLAGRSRTNYAHLLASALALRLTDVTTSGATTANLVDEPQNGQRPQTHALKSSTELVTITIGGNDIGYVGTVVAAAMPRALRWIPRVASMRRDALEPPDVDAQLIEVGSRLSRVASLVRERSPHARIVFVDYLTLLAPETDATAVLESRHADLVRKLELGLEAATARAAADNGCDVVKASAASRDHDPWSQVPWVSGAEFWPGRVPFHPNQAGMSAIAQLLSDHLTAQER